jgi:hypothetical protein
MISILIAKQNPYDNHMWLVDGNEIHSYYDCVQKWADNYFAGEVFPPKKPQLQYRETYLEGVSPRTVYGANLYKVLNTDYYVYIWEPK